MPLEGATPEGFRKSFAGCGWAVAVLMILLLAVVVAVLFRMRNGESGSATGMTTGAGGESTIRRT